MAIAAGTQGPALAEEDSPQGEPASEDSRARAGDGGDLSPEDAAILNDPALMGEVIEVFAERPDKPFDRDTEVRLTRQQLTQRGVTDLSEALELVPEISVRSSGRGGRIIDIRGARKGSIKVLIDGVPVADPFYGTFDVSSIPVTDIAQIRVSSSPASPIDGVGGPGGVIEVHTVDAVGQRRVGARVQGSSLPEGYVSATGRSMLSEHWAIRPSASATVGAHQFEIANSAEIGEGRHSATGSVRVEYRRDKRRLVADIAIQHRSFLVPPSMVMTDLRDIEGESGLRAGATLDDQAGGFALQGRAFASALARKSRVYRTAEDLAQGNIRRFENLRAARMGGSFLANRAVRKRFHVIGSATILSETANVTTGTTETEGISSIAELATGLQWEDGPFRIDSAVGVAVPLDVDASPWPEIKVAAWYRATRGVTFKLTGARKGRLPTVRERFGLDVGSEELDPEQLWFGEIGVELRTTRWFSLESSAYIRDTNGLIRVGERPDMMGIGLVNLGEQVFYGLDTHITVAPGGIVSGGASWNFITPRDLDDDRDASEPQDFLPRHRVKAWLAANLDDRGGARAQLRHTGSRWDRYDRETTVVPNPGVLPAFAVVDLSAHAALGRGLSANLRVDNLLDNRYKLRKDVLAPGRIIMLSLYGQWE